MEQTRPVVLTALNAQYLHASPAPFALLAGIRAFCTQPVCARVEEATVNEPLAGVAARIAALRPCVLGLSCYIWNITQSLALAQAVRRAVPDCYIVLGGPEVSYRSAALLGETPWVDGILCGEGERPFALLCDRLAAGRSLADVPGLTLRGADGAVRAGVPYLPEEDPPTACIPEYLAAIPGRIAYLETSRGCPFRCAFCLSGRCGGARWFSLERAKADLLALAGAKPRVLKLVDRTFNANAPRAEALLEFILREQGRGIPAGLCVHLEIAADLLTPRMLTLLAAMPAGAVQLEVGLQSFSPAVLEAVRRRTDLEAVVGNVSAVLSRGNVHLHLDLIAGLPGEGLAAFIQGFHRAYALRPHMLQLGFLKLLHGAAMREEPETYPCRFSPQPPYAVVDTPWISAPELAQLRLAESALDRMYNSGRFRRTADYAVAAAGCTPFSLFLRVGEAAARDPAPSLDAYTALVQQTLAALPGVQPTLLRDALVQDALATRGDGRLPPCLHRQDPLLRQAKHALAVDPATRSLPGRRRGIALLYGKKQVVFCDFEEKHPVTGEYPLHFAPFPG